MHKHLWLVQLIVLVVVGGFIGWLMIHWLVGGQEEIINGYVTCSTPHCAEGVSP